MKRIVSWVMAVGFVVSLSAPAVHARYAPPNPPQKPTLQCNPQEVKELTEEYVNETAATINALMNAITCVFGELGGEKCVDAINAANASMEKMLQTQEQLSEELQDCTKTQ